MADPALLHVDVRKAAPAVILDLQGKLAVGFGDELLRDTLDELFTEGWKAVLVNLTKVSFIDSAGLGELVAALRRAQREGVSLKLLNNKTGRVQETLYVSRILPLFEVFESEGSGARRAASLTVAGDDVVREIAQRLGAGAEAFDGGTSGLGQIVGQCPRALDACEGNERGLLLVLTAVLPGGRRVPRRVEQVVDDLERQPEVLRVRRPRPGARRRTPATSCQGCRADEERAGLAAVDELEGRKSKVDAGGRRGPSPARRSCRSMPIARARSAANNERVAASGPPANPRPGSRRRGSGARRRRGWRSPRRGRRGRPAGPGACARRPCTAGRRGSGSRCAPSPPRMPRAGRGRIGAEDLRDQEAEDRPQALGGSHQAVSRRRSRPGPTRRAATAPKSVLDEDASRLERGLQGLESSRVPLIETP